jgi:small subunit ribosomal protein S12
VLTKVQYLVKKNRQIRKKRIKTFLLRKCPQKKATCVKILLMSPKKPNSAMRKVAKVAFTTQKRKAYCYIPGIKHNLQKFSTVLLRGGRTKDLPGLRYKLIRGVGDLKNVYDRWKARSKYGIKKE